MWRAKADTSAALTTYALYVNITFIRVTLCFARVCACMHVCDALVCGGHHVCSAHKLLPTTLPNPTLHTASSSPPSNPHLAHAPSPPDHSKPPKPPKKPCLLCATRSTPPSKPQHAHRKLLTPQQPPPCVLPRLLCTPHIVYPLTTPTTPTLCTPPLPQPQGAGCLRLGGASFRLWPPPLWHAAQHS